MTVTPSYHSFLALAEGMPIDSTTKARGVVPEAGRLIAAAERLLDGGKITVVTVNVPLVTVPSSGRRAADSAVSGVYRGRNTPLAERDARGVGRNKGAALGNNHHPAQLLSGGCLVEQPVERGTSSTGNPGPDGLNREGLSSPDRFRTSHM